MNIEHPRTFRAEKLIRPPITDSVKRLQSYLTESIAMRGPLDLEIGCGVGWHPIRYAGENPCRTLVAIEQTTEKYKKFESRLRGQKKILNNLIPVQADAVSWIPFYIPDHSLSRVFILYPNPNPKNAAARWFRMPFFSCLIKKIIKNGEIILRTNREDYAIEAASYAEAIWKLNPESERKFSESDIRYEEIQTHFERKYLAAGEFCTELTFRV